MMKKSLFRKKCLPAALFLPNNDLFFTKNQFLDESRTKKVDIYVFWRHRKFLGSYFKGTLYLWGLSLLLVQVLAPSTRIKNFSKDLFVFP